MKKIACIVLPTYNEAENVIVLIPEIFKQAKKIESHELHVLVVDDSSPDGTAKIVKQFQKNYPHLHLISGKKEGLGEAYKRGMKHAIEELKSDIIFEMDADLQHDPKILPLFVTLYNNGFSLVIGSRFAPGGTTPNFGLYRKFLSFFGNWLVRFLGGLPRLHDCTSGYRLIKSDLIQKCDMKNLSTRGYSFQTSLLFELLRNGAKVLEIPIMFPDRKHGVSKLALQDQVEFMVNLVKIRFGKYYEFVRYGFIGTFGIFVNLGIYVTLFRFVGWSIELSGAIAIEMSILSNFLLSNLWNLKTKEGSPGLFSKMFKYHSISALGATVNFVVLLVLFYNFGFHYITANFIGIILSIFINYGMNAYFSWKELNQHL
jgi:dolichol-phosphate mannosyltransferase